MSHNSVFFQINDLDILDMVPQDNGWYSNPVRDHIRALSVISAWQGQEQMPAYFYVKSVGQVEEQLADGYGGWSAGGFEANICEGSQIGNYRDYQNGLIYVYLQTKEDPLKITEITSWPWRVSSTLP